jgi:hypothetical protein
MASQRPGQDDPAAEVDAGLLVTHGVGVHARTSTLKSFVDPLLHRLAEEGQLVNVSALRLGEDEAIGGQYDALIVRYLRRRDAAGGVSGEERRLLIVEGRWSEAFLKSGSAWLLSWAGRNAIPMTWQLLGHNARSPLKLIASLLTLALLGAGIYFSRGVLWVWPALAVIAALGIATLSIVDDTRDVRREAQGMAGWLSAVAATGTLVIYQVQRGLVFSVAALGLVVLPVAAVLVGWLASLPFSSRLAFGLMSQIEALLLNGGAADMEAVSTNHVTAATIRTRLRGALVEIEQRVKPGGTVTVLAHSGGSPPAWRLLSEPEIGERPESAGLRYRLLTAGAALNWARKGFGSPATPLDDPLVNHARDESQRTLWLNFYSSWDPIPHGRVDPAPFKGWAPYPESADPNRLVRNLGAPVPGEHGEYWRNQQEFVPLLARAIDEEIEWRGPKPGERQRLWTNCRLALLSALVRTRLVIVALPVAALIEAMRGTRFLSCSTDGFGSGVTDALGSGASWAMSRLLYDAAYDDLCASPRLVAALIVVVLALAAYALLDVYTNLLWHSLGRRAILLRPDIGGGDSRIAVPVVPALLVWVPSVLLMPALLYPFQLGGFWWAATFVNTALACLEVFWLNGCLRAFARPEGDALARVHAAPIARQRQEAQQQAQYAPSP